ncbi:MAG TPA: hypothetical protein P5120_15360, partial [Spirochaetota bacterium]|nr:hypothetical protein [Spirochaetota bacterium]
MNRKKKIYLALSVFTALYIIAVTAFIVWSNESRRKLIINEVDHKLLIAARSIKYILPADFHDRATGP